MKNLLNENVRAQEVEQMDETNNKAVEQMDEEVSSFVNLQKRPDFSDVLPALKVIPNVRAVIKGNRLYVSGDTRPHRPMLKEYGFLWHGQYMLWYLERSTMTMDKLKELGGEEVNLNNV